MAYREECLVRLGAARARMDDALLHAPNASVLRDSWHAVLRDLEQEQPPEQDRMWLSDRLLDLQLHVYNSPQWRQSFEGIEAVKREPSDHTN